MNFIVYYKEGRHQHYFPREVKRVDTEEQARNLKKNLNSILSEGEKKHYGCKYFYRKAK